MDQSEQPASLPEPILQPEPHERVINPPVERQNPKQHLKQFLAGIIAIMVLVIIGAIGYYLGMNNSPKQPIIKPITPKATTVPTIINITTPVATISGFVINEPVETSPSSPLGDTMNTKPNKLIILTNKTNYKKGSDIIYITIANGLYQPIYAQDEQTNCKIVSLEYLQDTEWKAIDDCYLGRLPATVTIGTQHGRIIKVETKPLPPLPANDPNSFKPGLYRVAYTYSFSINGPQFGGELIRPLTAYSAPFSIEQ